MVQSVPGYQLIIISLNLVNVLILLYICVSRIVGRVGRTRWLPFDFRQIDIPVNLLVVIKIPESLIG